MAGFSHTSVVPVGFQTPAPCVEPKICFSSVVTATKVAIFSSIMMLLMVVVAQCCKIIYYQNYLASLGFFTLLMDIWALFRVNAGIKYEMAKYLRLFVMWKPIGAVLLLLFDLPMLFVSIEGERRTKPEMVKAALLLGFTVFNIVVDLCFVIVVYQCARWFRKKNEHRMALTAYFLTFDQQNRRQAGRYSRKTGSPERKIKSAAKNATS